MKFRRRAVAIVCAALIPSLCLTLVVEEPSRKDAVLENRRLDARKAAVAHELVKTSTTSAPASKATKVEIGTKDAPVDGLDGKPHEGPFVDSLPPKRLGSTNTGSRKSKPLPEDGVMNDPNRTPPKQGTTGTEGGVSEKDRDRVLQESKTGTKQLKVPDAPREPPPPPAGDRLGIGKGVKEELKRQAAAGKDVIGSISDKVKAAAAIAGLEKPADLPDRPHDIPHPDPIDRTKDQAMNELDTESKMSSLTDEPSQAEGAHDLIPWDSFFGSFSSIAATEIGDKTFIVAALMAMRHPRLLVFTAAYSALFVMTILSGVAGHLVGTLISKRWSALLAALLFLVFGVKSLREGLAMSPDQGVSEEMREVQAELEEKEVDITRRDHRGSSVSDYALESGRAGARRSRSRSGVAPRRGRSSSRSPSPSKRSVKSTIGGMRNLLSLLLSPAWVETFSMTFVGELGDRSQIATVAMAAGQEYYWVMVGACLGHFICTAVAVIGGSVLAGRVSMRKVTLAGGAVFIFFGIFTLYEAKEYFF